MLVVTGRPSILFAWAHSGEERAARRWLECRGFAVASVSKGQDALALFEARNPAVVLLDKALADTTGASLCAAVRCLPNGVRVPVLVAHDDDAGIDEALDAGATDVVAKPVHWKSFSRRVAWVARAFEMQRELELTRGQLAGAERVATDAQARLSRLRTLDPLTGLPNRCGLERRIHAVLQEPGSGNLEGVVMCLDLDRFKEVNETVGRCGGDDALKQVAGRLDLFLREHVVGVDGRGAGSGATVARLGQDEFGLLVMGLTLTQLADLGEGLLRQLSTPLVVDGLEIFLSASLGVASFPADGLLVDALLEHAETAMHEAKRRGGGRSVFYNRSLRRRTRHKLQHKLHMDRMLHRAFERGELELAYQPIVEPETGSRLGVEALLRWHHPEWGTVAPLEFIPMAEESGFMVQIGHWVLRTACRRLRVWLDRGIPPLRMAVNVSACQVECGDLLDVVRAILQETGINPALLELELCERGVLRNEPHVHRQLEDLKALGVRLAVDDFGTGHSALAYLRRFPLDVLKIDRHLIGEIPHNEVDVVLVSTIIDMAHHLQLEVIAEGVETWEQLSFLRQQRCEALQGFLISPAVGASEIESETVPSLPFAGERLLRPERMTLDAV